jgi:lipopolysaccharide export system protein LptC
MMWFPRFRRGLIYWIPAMVCLVAVGVAQEPMEDLRIPLEHYPTGELKTELFADRAEVPPDGSIVAFGLILKSFTVDGELVMEIQAEDCVCDRVAQVASSSNHVSLTRGDINVSGDGFTWSGADEKLKILNNARVVFPTAMMQKEGVFDRVRGK